MNIARFIGLAALAGTVIGTLVGTGTASAGTVLDRIKASSSLRVCIWPDYYGITYRSPRTGQLGGIDIELSAEFAKALGVKLVYVDSSFASPI